MTTIRNLIVLSSCLFAAVACTKAEGEETRVEKPARSEVAAKVSGDNAPEAKADEPAAKAEVPADGHAKPGVLSDEQIGKGFVTMVAELTTVLKGHTSGEGDDVKVDCDGLADATTKIFEANGDLIAAARELDKDDDRATALEKKHGKDLEKGIGEFMGGVGKHCKDHEGMQAALKAFGPSKPAAH